MSGPVLALTESQYRFGVGPILLRGMRVLAEVIVDDETWWEVEAEVANGTAAAHGGWTPRTLYVIDAALRPRPGRRPRDHGAG